jgi:hypothetical protein
MRAHRPQRCRPASPRLSPNNTLSSSHSIANQPRVIPPSPLLENMSASTVWYHYFTAMERDDRPNVAYSQSIRVEKRRTFCEAFSVPLSPEELRQPTRKWQKTTLRRRVVSDEHRASAYVLDGPNPSLPPGMFGGKVTVEKKEDVPFMDFIQKVVTDTVVKAVDKAKHRCSMLV